MSWDVVPAEAIEFNGKQPAGDQPHAVIWTFPTKAEAVRFAVKCEELEASYEAMLMAGKLQANCLKRARELFQIIAKSSPAVNAMMPRIEQALDPIQQVKL